MQKIANAIHYSRIMLNFDFIRLYAWFERVDKWNAFTLNKNLDNKQKSN